MTYTTQFTVDEVGFIQIALTKVLAAASRGLDTQGEWVGFDRARQIHQVRGAK